MHWRLFFKVLVLSAFISAVVASLFLYPIGEAGHVAAWVQAIGSIAAIAGAVYAAREGAKANAKLKEAKQHHAVLAITETFLEKVEDLVEAASASYLDSVAQFRAIYSPSSLDVFLRTIDAVPVLELPTPSAMAAMLRFQFHTQLFMSAADRLESGHWSPTNPNYDRLIEARNNYDRFEKLYGVDDRRTHSADKILIEQVRTSIIGLSNHVKVQADALKVHAEVLRKELA